MRCPFPLPLGKALGWSEPGVSWALGEGEERVEVSKGPFPGALRPPPLLPSPFSPLEDAGIRRQYLGSLTSTEASLERSQHLLPSPAEKSTLGMGYVARPEMLKAEQGVCGQGTGLGVGGGTRCEK